MIADVFDGVGEVMVVEDNTGIAGGPECSWGFAEPRRLGYIARPSWPGDHCDDAFSTADAERCLRSRDYRLTFLVQRREDQMEMRRLRSLRQSSVDAAFAKDRCRISSDDFTLFGGARNGSVDSCFRGMRLPDMDRGRSVCRCAKSRADRRAATCRVWSVRQ